MFALTIPSAVTISKAARDRMFDTSLRFWNVMVVDGGAMLDVAVEAVSREEALGKVIFDVLNEDGGITINLQGAVVTEVVPSTYDEIESWMVV